MKKHQIIIRQHRPWFRAALIGGSAFVIAVSAFALYSYTRRTTVTEFARTKTELEQLRDERRELARELRTAKAEVTTLREQLVYIERTNQIDTQANAEVKASLANLQAEAAELREQVAFYRSIVSPDESRVGVRILEMKVSPTAVANNWRYDLVLIQSVRHDKRVSGAIEIGVRGSRNGQAQTLKLAELTANAKSPEFSFKYFQEFSGEFVLPQGFRPLRVTVTLIPQGEGMPRIDDEFEWAKALADKGKQP